ncbi:preprotein translocase subunit SECE1 [Argentina anserina]|uniref:preprotein translocase subunit SECE1 n=1 Tax=Argentina anserina TaxID=57926 RepID=UPI0021764DFE|nr:preprotein translocase subunit SECE1 [Potentilla anserina]
MATLRFLSQVPVMSPFPSSSKSGNPTSSVRLHPPRAIHLTKKSSSKRKPPLLTPIKAVDEGQANSDTTEAKGEPSAGASEPGELSELGAEIKKAMEERKEKEKEGGGGGDLFSGVAEEVREIEWPVFGKVLGTTGVVLGVIAGSSVVLLTVNAVLAELSDRVFAGKGVQDFFG